MSNGTIQRSIPLDNIRIDGGTQSRAQIHTDVVTHYAQQMEDGALFPPAMVFFDGRDYWLADGFHRYHANRTNGKQGMVCRIEKGTVRDAILYSYSANGLHGLQMSSEDKRHIVLEMLNDFEWSQWSDREIARKCCVSHTLVSKLRASMGGNSTEMVKYKDQKGNTHERNRNTKEVKKRKELGNVANLKEQPVAEVTDKHDEKQDAIEYLIEENDKLKAQLAVGTAEDPEFTKNLIDELQADLKQTKIELNAVIKSRDMYQAECAQLKKQVASYQRQLKKAA